MPVLTPPSAVFLVLSSEVGAMSLFLFPGIRRGLRNLFEAVCVCVCVFSRSVVSIFATLWTVAHQAPLSLRFPRQEYWSGLPFPSPGDLPDPGIEPAFPVSPALQADSFPAEPSDWVWPAKLQ